MFDQAVATKEMKGWTSAAFDDSKWPLVATSAKAGDLPWGELVARPIPLFRRSTKRKYVSTRIVIDDDDGDGWKALAAGTFINGGKFAIPPPQPAPATLPACKLACAALSACKAFVWDTTNTTANSKCALRRNTMLAVHDDAKKKKKKEKSRTVYLRAFTRLIGELPYDAQVTPTIGVAKKAETDEHAAVFAEAELRRLESLESRLDSGASTSMRIDMRTDSYFTDGLSLNKANGEGIPNNRAAYTFDPTSPLSEPFEYESVGWLVGHSMQYSVDKHSPLAPLLSSGALEVGYFESGFDVDMTPAWSSKSNANLTLLWKKAQRTLYVNARDNYMDCPDRERSQWWFDVSLDVHQSFYALDVAAQSLAKKGILELANWQKTGSLAEPWAPLSIYAPVPGGWQSELPDQSLMSIAYGVATYYKHTGDTATIRATIHAFAAYLLSWSMDTVNGLVLPRDCAKSSTPKPHAADAQCNGVWDWCDGQSVNCDYAPIDNAWYYFAVNSTAMLARAVHATSGASPLITAAQLSELDARAASIMSSYDSMFWDTTCSCYRSKAHRDRAVGGTTTCVTKLDNCTLPDDRVQALAIVTGLAPRSKWKEIVGKTLDLDTATATPNGASTFSSPPMEKFVLEAMFLAEETDAALARMESRFGRMIAYNYSTLWEHWDWDPMTGAPVAGYNHGWSGGALVLLSQHVAGLAPTSKKGGWETFDVAPRLGSSLRDVTAHVLTQHGAVRVIVEKKKKKKEEEGEEEEEGDWLSVQVLVPLGAVATVRLPGDEWRRTSVVPAVVGGGEEEHLVLVGPGEWTIIAHAAY